MPFILLRTRNASISQNYQRIAYAPKCCSSYLRILRLRNKFFFFFLFSFCLVLTFWCIYQKSKTRGLPGEALGSRSQPLAWFSLESMEANALFMASVSFWRKVSIIFFAKTEIPWYKVRQRRSYTINIQ